jgi:hypothetical protein
MLAPLISVPTTPSGQDPEVAMIVGAVVIAAAVLICGCSVTVLRRGVALVADSTWPGERVIVAAQGGDGVC